MNGERTGYVLDSFALLAYFGAEPGEPQVKALLAQAERGQAVIYLCIINFGEALYVIERRQGTVAARRAVSAVDQLPVTVVEADRRLTFAAAHFKACHPLSYADAFAAALAQELQANLVTGAPQFRAIEHLISVQWLPQGE